MSTEVLGGPGGIWTRDLPELWFRQLANRTFFGPAEGLVYQAELPAHFHLHQFARTFNPYQPGSSPGFSQAFKSKICNILSVLEHLETFLTNPLLKINSSKRLLVEDCRRGRLKVLCIELRLSRSWLLLANLAQSRSDSSFHSINHRTGISAVSLGKRACPCNAMRIIEVEGRRRDLNSPRRVHSLVPLYGLYATKFRGVGWTPLRYGGHRWTVPSLAHINLSKKCPNRIWCQFVSRAIIE